MSMPTRKAFFGAAAIAALPVAARQKPADTSAAGANVAAPEQ